MLYFYMTTQLRVIVSYDLLIVWMRYQLVRIIVSVCGFTHVTQSGT